MHAKGTRFPFSFYFRNNSANDSNRCDGEQANPIAEHVETAYRSDAITFGLLSELLRREALSLARWREHEPPSGSVVDRYRAASTDLNMHANE